MGTEEGHLKTLAGLLDALASPVRLRLVSQLRQPRVISALRVQRWGSERGVKPERPMTTANVRGHLQQLLKAGVVGRTPVVVSGRTVDHYQVNRPQLFALTEEIRQLALLGGGSAVPDGTLLAEPPALGARVAGPHLVL